MCNNWPDFPAFRSGATGGLIGNTAMICGGATDISYHSNCYSLTSEKATSATQLSLTRVGAASVVLNEKTLWVTGGSGGGGSTEYVTVTRTMFGPNLPMAHQWHYGYAIVAINRTCSMVIGGHDFFPDDYSASTYIYDHNQGEWINGPSLIQARYLHAAGIVTDAVTDEQFVAVTGGFYYPDYLDITELLQDGEWVEGKLNDIICYL